MVFFIAFVVFPLIDSFSMSLHSKVSQKDVFVGFANFLQLFGDAPFLKSFLNTFKFVIIIVPMVLGLSLALASVIIEKAARVQTFFRAAFYLPVVISIVSISLVWKSMYNFVYGMLNYLLKAIGMAQVNWLGDVNIVILSLSVVILTSSLGQPIILFLAALGGIPATYYEAADIDGAGAWQKFRRITIPLVMPTTLYVLTTTTIAAFQTFSVINLMTGGGPSYASSTALFLIYKTAFLYGNFNLASTMGVVLFLCVALLGAVQFQFFSKSVEY